MGTNATLTKGTTFAATEEVTNTKLNALVDEANISNIKITKEQRDSR